MLSKLISLLEPKLNKTDPDVVIRADFDGMLSDDLTIDEKRKLASATYALILLLDAHRAHIYIRNNTTSNVSILINECTQKLLDNKEFKKLWSIPDAPIVAPIPPINVNISNPTSAQTSWWEFYLFYLDYQEYLKVQAQKNTTIITSQTNVQLQQQQVNEEITLANVIRTRQLLEAQLSVLKISYDNDDNHLLNVQRALKEKQDTLISQYENAKAANDTSSLDRLNDAMGLAMLIAYIAGSVGSAFYYVTVKCKKETMRLEIFDGISGIDAGLTFANWLFFAWNVIDGIAVLVDAATDYQNGDKGWAKINALNGIQLLAVTGVGHWMYETEIEFATEVGTFTGLSLAAAGFALCMFLCSYVAYRKEKDAEKLIETLNEPSDLIEALKKAAPNNTDKAKSLHQIATADTISKIDAIRSIHPNEDHSTILTRNLTVKQADAILQAILHREKFLHQIPNNQNIIQRIDAIRKARLDGQYSHILTCDLTKTQALAILKIEALYQNKSKTAWFGCGVTMTAVFLSTLSLAGGAFPPILATIILIGLIWNCIDRYQLRQAGKLTSQMTKDVLSDKSLEKTDNFYRNINDTYDKKSNRTYLPTYKIGIDKSSKNIEMLPLNDKYISNKA